MAAKKNANFTKAMKLVENGKSGFRILGLTRKLAPEDVVVVFEALAKRKTPRAEEAPDLLAEAYAGAGRFEDALRVGKKGKYPGTLQKVAEAALDAGAFDVAESAFAAVKKPSAAVLVGLALAQKSLGKSAKATLARAEKLNVVKGAIEWKSASYCYARVNQAVATAMIASVSGDMKRAKRTLTEARAELHQIPQKGVRKECDDQLAEPSDPSWWGSTIARHAGL
jgi:hypothetical protein